MQDLGIIDVLPIIPSKRYFSMSEMVELCGVKAHVLRYWESEFKQLSPVKRQGNHRYYQRNDVFLVRQIKELLYIQGYTISGAKDIFSSTQKKTPSSTGSFDKKLIKSMITELNEISLLLK
jgi:DNA-binding transcriptional MerR regulator